jgi:hypothetical protein
MTITSIPGWNMVVGTIDTDVSISTSKSTYGISSLYFKNTQPANNVKIISDWIPLDQFRPHMARCTLQASSNNAADILKAYVYTYEADKTTNLESRAVKVTSLTAADTWYAFEADLDVGARVAYMYLEKTKVNAFSAYCGQFEIKPIPVSFSASSADVTSCPNNSWQAIEFTSTSHNYGNYYDAANSQFVAPWPMVMHFDVGVRLNHTMTAGDIFHISLGVDGTGVKDNNQICIADAPYRTISADVPLTKGQVVNVAAIQNHGVALNTDSDSIYTFFNGHEIT